MELNQLRHFLAVLGAGSISRAAEQLEIRQPSLSQSIKALERSVGAELLVRTGGGVRATRIGETFAKYAQVIVREATKATAEVAAMRGTGAGRIALAVHSALARYLAPTILADFLARASGVRIDLAIFSCARREVIQRLQRAEWDLVLTFASTAAGCPPEIVFERLRPIESRVYCGIDHPLARRMSVTLEELSRCEWIGDTLGLTEELLAEVFLAHRPAPIIRVRADSVECTPELASVYPLLCMMPKETAAGEVAAGRLIEVRQSCIRSETHIAMLSSGLVERTADMRALMASISARVGLSAVATPARRVGSPR
jgi:LysR family transcriptional regulator of abg operon